MKCEIKVDGGHTMDELVNQVRAKIIKKNLEETNRFICNIMKVATLIGGIDVLFVLFQNNFKFKITTVIIALSVLLTLYPVIYYKISKTKKYFVIIALSTLEVITFAVYLSSWVFAAILLVISFVVATMYFEPKIIKRLLIIKIPIIILANYLASVLYGDYVLDAGYTNTTTTSVYYVLQIIIIGYICNYIAKKFGIILDNCIKQNETMSEMFVDTMNSVDEIHSSIENLNSNINKNQKSLVDIEDNSVNIANRADSLVNSTKNTQSAFDNIILGISATSSNSEEITNLSKDIGTIATVNKNNIEELESKINEINIAGSESKGYIKELVSSTVSIDKALNVINTVMDQTNLLALNASIEAARAGEAGKGFAVVAQEVKNLSIQSAESAQNISNIIKTIEIYTNSSYQSMDRMIHLINDNLALIDRTKQDFTGLYNKQSIIVDKISESRNYIEQLSNHIEEVHKVIEVTSTQSNEISEEINQISEVIGNLNMSFEDIVLYSETIKGSSQSLKKHTI